MIPTSKLSAWDLNVNQRARFVPEESAATDHWFRYNSFTTDLEFASLANSVARALTRIEWIFQDFRGRAKMMG